MTEATAAVTSSSTGTSLFDAAFTQNQQLAHQRVPWVPARQRASARRSRLRERAQRQRRIDFHQLRQQVGPRLVNGPGSKGATTSANSATTSTNHASQIKQQGDSKLPAYLAGKGLASVLAAVPPPTATAPSALEPPTEQQQQQQPPSAAAAMVVDPWTEYRERTRAQCAQYAREMAGVELSRQRAVVEERRAAAVAKATAMERAERASAMARDRVWTEHWLTTMFEHFQRQLKREKSNHQSHHQSLHRQHQLLRLYRQAHEFVRPESLELELERFFERECSATGQGGQGGGLRRGGSNTTPSQQQSPSSPSVPWDKLVARSIEGKRERRRRQLLDVLNDTMDGGQSTVQQVVAQKKLWSDKWNAGI